jgi:nitroreductase
MNTLDAIFSRRSIRKFDGRPVGRAILLQILKAAMYAPSARNSQAWHFIVEEDRARLMQLARIHPYGKMLGEAGAAILVCGDRSIDDSLLYQVQNCSAATQNALLAAHALGVGAVWLGIQPREKRIQDMKEFFKLPGHVVPVSLIAIGHPLEQPAIPERFSPDKIKFGEWSDQ